MSFSMSKLKSFLPGNQNSNNENHRSHTMILEPEIGFQLNVGKSSNNSKKPYENDKSISELNVSLIAARHLPSTFGFKTVQGYVIKVKLFPGTNKFDSTIQTSTWPKFNENFKFPLEPAIKSSVKNYTKDKSYENLPDKLFDGHFVVFTAYALLELPSGHLNRFRGAYRSLRDKSSSLIQKMAETNNENTDENKTVQKPKETIESAIQLTKSESRRNIGSVTCYLEPKLFKKNPRTDQYETDEIWLPIKDLTITTSKLTNSNVVSTAKKGQIELILELCDTEMDDELIKKDIESTKIKGAKQKLKSHYTELKRKIKTASKSQSMVKMQYLKVTTSKMRCSIKVKDEFEQNAGLIYIKTTVYSANTLLDSWKCDNFLPSISIRFDPNTSTIIIPLSLELNLSDISIKTTVATKNKMGKKIILGTILIGAEVKSTANQSQEHWQSTIETKNQPITMWHNFQ